MAKSGTIAVKSSYSSKPWGAAFDKRRDKTALERKLDKLATRIGQVGLAAGAFSLAAMAGQFTWQHFVVGGEAWQWEYASIYLHYLITSVTIVVSHLL